VRYSDERLEQIFDKTSGYCHICCGKLAFCNYGIRGTRGAWNVEHSVPRALGGTDHLNNLYPAHIDCNERKRTDCTRRSRAVHGRNRAPYSIVKRKEKQVDNAIRKGIIGGATGGVVFGPAGFILGALLGAASGYVENPD
jgi:5-methylcytosine-specific restriction endonuclease McrA